MIANDFRWCRVLIPLHRFLASGGIMLRTALVTIAFAFHVCVLASSGNSNTRIAVNPTDTQQLIDREQEIELALKAAPVHLREDAAVFVFTKNGYEEVRPGNNGFNCMVNRDGMQNGDGAVHPTCWDPDGSRTIRPVMLR